jgi:hypothetical protein
MGLNKECNLQEELIVVVAGTPRPKETGVTSIPSNTSKGKEAIEPNETERDNHKGN